jgi:hypothetical protein
VGVFYLGHHLTDILFLSGVGSREIEERSGGVEGGEFGFEGGVVGAATGGDSES